MQITTQLWGLENLRVSYIGLNHKYFSISSTFPELLTLNSCSNLSFSVSVLTLKILIFYAACCDNLKKEPRITTVITTILNFGLKFIHLAPMIMEFEPDLTPPLFWRRFAITVLLPYASSITNTLPLHFCLPDALSFPLADCKKWLGSFSTAFFLFHYIRQINKINLH